MGLENVNSNRVHGPNEALIYADPSSLAFGRIQSVYTLQIADCWKCCIFGRFFNDTREFSNLPASFPHVIHILPSAERNLRHKNFVGCGSRVAPKISYTCRKLA